MESHELTRRLINGDVLAIREIYDKHAQQVRCMAKNLLKNEQDIEEVIQDVFLDLWASRNKIKFSKGYQPLLFTIAKRRTIDKFRKRINTFGLDTIAPHHLVENKTENDFFFNEMSSYMEKKINELPPKRRQVFLLRKEASLTNKEIAETLGISTTMVEKQMKLANQFLREAYSYHAGVVLLIYFFQNL